MANKAIIHSNVCFIKVRTTHSFANFVNFQKSMKSYFPVFLRISLLLYGHLVYLILKVLKYEIRIYPKSHNKVTMTVYVWFEFLWNRLYLLIINSNFRILIRNKFWRIWYRAVVKSYQELLFMAVLLWIKRKRLNLKNLHKIVLKTIRLRRILFHAAWTFQEHHLMAKTWLNRWKMQVNRRVFLDFFKTAAPEIYVIYFCAKSLLIASLASCYFVILGIYYIMATNL